MRSAGRPRRARRVITPLLRQAVGLTLSVGVAIHEWIYRHDHPYASGVSGVLVVLALAVAAGCVAALQLSVARMREAEIKQPQ